MELVLCLESRWSDVPESMTTDESTFEILLAEDNPADATLVREALREHDLKCALHIIHDGAQAIEFIERLDQNPAAPRLDLMLLDMHLPKCDGEEILGRLRCTKRYARTPVIVMSASESPRDYENARRGEALHFFKKPTTLDEFLELGAIVRRIIAPAQIPGESAG